VDGFSGILMRAGMDRVLAFVLPSLIASLFFVAILYLFYMRVLRSWPLALLACTLFFTNGGAGFMDLVWDLVEAPSLDLLLYPPREYTYFPKRHIVWINIISSEMLPQRSLLFGMPLALAIFTAVWRYSQRGFADVSRT
jgi:hypothetical protein